jgi:hypothetical protein
MRIAHDWAALATLKRTLSTPLGAAAVAAEPDCGHFFSTQLTEWLERNGIIAEAFCANPGNISSSNDPRARWSERLIVSYRRHAF